MSIHVQTGHRLDVLYSIGTDGHKYLQGIQPRRRAGSVIRTASPSAHRRTANSSE